MVAPVIDIDQQLKDRAQHTYKTMLAFAKEETAAGYKEQAKEIDLLAEHYRKSYAERGIQLEG